MVPRIVREFGMLRIETVDWPVILMELPEDVVPMASLLEGLDYLEQLYRQSRLASEKTFQITDLTRMRSLAPASQRKAAADWVQRTAPLQKVASLGGANVTPSTILRGVITAINWFAPPPMTTVFVATRREAYAAAIRAFEAARTRLPAGHRAHVFAR